MKLNLEEKFKIAISFCSSLDQHFNYCGKQKTTRGRGFIFHRAVNWFLLKTIYLRHCKAIKGCVYSFNEVYIYFIWFHRVCILLLLQFYVFHVCCCCDVSFFIDIQANIYFFHFNVFFIFLVLYVITILTWLWYWSQFWM